MGWRATRQYKHPRSAVSLLVPTISHHETCETGYETNAASSCRNRCYINFAFLIGLILLWIIANLTFEGWTTENKGLQVWNAAPPRNSYNPWPCHLYTVTDLQYTSHNIIGLVLTSMCKLGITLLMLRESVRLELSIYSTFNESLISSQGLSMESQMAMHSNVIPTFSYTFYIIIWRKWPLSWRIFRLYVLHGVFFLGGGANANDNKLLLSDIRILIK